MNAFKQQCVALRKKDLTLNEIMEKIGRSKTSVYFHIKDIPLSFEKQNKIRESSRKRALELAGSRKGKSKRPFSTFETWNQQLILLVAHLLFDGEITKSRCVYNNRSLALLKRVEELMELLYSYEPIRYCNEKTDVKRISYNNVALSRYLMEKSEELLSTICEMSLSYKREFIRAFFDDEGCMDFRRNRNLRRIRGYQKERRILMLIKKLLSDFAISSDIFEPNEIVIRGKENLLKFQKEINFSKGVCINGHRSNSIWKKPIEKRTLLDMAIKSFKT